jgi:hypothetical protein
MFTSIKITNAMNTTEILNKSLAWFYYKEQGMNGSKMELNSLLQSYSQNQLLGLEIAGGTDFRNTFGYEVNDAGVAAVDIAGVQQVAPQEVYILTQVILNTLNTEPEKFHVMAEIPGLEAGAGNQLAKVASYLIKQGWIEAKTTEAGLLVKLTIQGKLYLRNNDAWA